MYKSILVATDGSPLAAVAVDGALALARDLGARVTIVTVTRPMNLAIADSVTLSAALPELDKYAREESARILSEAEHKARALGVAYEVVQVEDDRPYKAIIETAKKRGCDLIAMASHGRRGISALVLGSETLKVLTHSTIPVLVYR